ncbi:HET-domain-containing protein [Astrocystis sublimbata]|nr:HET-domain-containing protein [Astrocystis sublimbata]
MLCSICDTFDIRELLVQTQSQPTRPFFAYGQPSGQWRLGIPDFKPHHKDLLSLRSSARHCDLCRCLWEACKLEHQKNLNPAHTWTDATLGAGTYAEQIFVGTDSWGTGRRDTPLLTVRQNYRDLARLEVCALRDHEPVDPQGLQLLARSVYPSSASEECLRFAAASLHNCLNNHKTCSPQGPKPSALPTRIIDTASEHPKVVDSEGRSGLYTALSYRWGSETDFQLTCATEHSFREGRPLDQFPATLRDAVIVTRALGIRYLWVDAVCIFQDSHLDWAQEASRMCLVYTGAAVTIAASCASDTNAGFLREREKPPIPMCWLDWKVNGTITGRVFLRPEFRAIPGVLDGRGWVLQETLLASRTLSFGAEQLIFECAKGKVWEGSGHHYEHERYRKLEFMQQLRSRRFAWWRRRLLTLLRRFDMPVALLLPMPSLPNADSAMVIRRFLRGYVVTRPITLQGSFGARRSPKGLSHFDLWTLYVVNYTHRQISKLSDILPAISGLATEFHRSTGDVYLAGLWKLDITEGLAWMVTLEQRDVRPKVPRQYLAPSWSWASVSGLPVQFERGCQFDPVQRFARLVNFTIQPSTVDPFGSVQRGSITLNAPFLDMGSIDVREDLLNEISGQSESPQWQLLCLLKKQSEYMMKHMGYTGQRYAFLQLVKMRQRVGTYDSQFCDKTYFLLLESIEYEAGCWRRVACLPVKDLAGRDTDTTSISDNAESISYTESLSSDTESISEDDLIRLGILHETRHNWKKRKVTIL